MLQKKDARLKTLPKHSNQSFHTKLFLIWEGKVKAIFVFYSLLVLIITVYPRLDVPYIPSHLSFDKFAHTFMYFFFSYIYFRMRSQATNEQASNWQDNTSRKFLSKKEILLELFFLGNLISVFMEYIQKHIPGRSFCWFDILANLLGFYLFILVLVLKK